MQQARAANGRRILVLAAAILAVALWHSAAWAGGASSTPVVSSNIESTPMSFATVYPDLPPTAVVLSAIESASLVKLARSGVGVEGAQRERLLIGPYEFLARASLARRYDPLRAYHDAEIALERPIRIGEKASLDRRIGDAGLHVARLSLVDARHESARLLLRQWFMLLRAVDERSLWSQQLAVLQRQLEVVRGRVRAGDAPRSEVVLAEAMVAQAEQGASQGDARVELSRAELTASFPDLPLLNLPVIARPATPEADEASWRSRVLEHNHEIRIVSTQREQAALLVQRARADRIPDPVVGVRYLSERSGADHVLGVTFSIPIPGASRDAVLQSAVAQLDQRAERQAAVLRRVGGEASILYRTARSAFETWQKAEFAAQRLTQHADLAARAYSLGEGALNDVLLARRAANESRFIALGAQAESQEARYRLILDAHRLWPFDYDDIEANTPPR